MKSTNRAARHPPHCQLIQAGEIVAIVGDASRDGIGGRQYCGLWSLTSKHSPFNAFGNTYAGLIPGEIRGRAPTLEIVNETTCALAKPATQQHPVEARAIYQVKAPAYVAGDALEDLPAQENGQPFHWDRIRDRFAEPFYYGRLGPMVLILIFDQPRWLRFFCSPSGGGDSLRRGESCPAWDFEWIIPQHEYQVGRPYDLRMRLVYKKFVSDADVLREYRQTRQDLGFESKPHAGAR